MPKVKISEFDIDPANNTDINNINIAEGCAPSGINNAIRQLMSDLKEFQTGAGGDPFNGAVNGTVGATTPATGAFTTLSASSTATLNTLSSSGATITGGSINGTTVGASTASTGAFTTLSASGAFSANGGTTLGDASGDALTINSSAVSIPNGLNFASNNFVITTGGSIGVGTATPDIFGRFYTRSVGINSSGTTALQINGSTYGTIDLGAGGTRTTSLTGTSTEAQLATVTAIPILFTTNGTERMRITSTGNVGIGTSSPNILSWATALTVNNSLSNAAVELASGGVAQAYFSADSTNVILAAYANKPLLLRTNNLTRATFDTSGNLGLGATPSAWSGVTALEVVAGALYGTSAVTELSNNSYFNGTNYIYKTTGFAQRYRLLRSSGTHEWYTTASGTAGNAITFTQAMTLDASGNLGIGITSPDTGRRLHVLQNSSYSISALFESLSTSGSTIAFQDADSTGASNVRVGSDADALVAWAGGTERMRIDSSGKVGIGVTSLFEQFEVKGATTYIGQFNQTQTAAGSGVRVILAGDRSADSSNFAFRYEDGVTQRMRVLANGNVQNTNNSYGGISDIKLKENIVDATPKLEKLNQVRVINYNLIGEEQKQIGVVAQELEEIFPSMIEESPDKDVEGNDLGTVTKSVKYSVFVPMLIKAIQEQQAIINDLKARIETLESK
jgi:hypothetical protein